MEGARLGDGERLPVVAGETVQGLRGGDPDAAVGGDRRGSHAVLVETVERARGLERVLGQAQQAAAHADPDVVVAIAIERPGRAAHAVLVFDGLEQRVRACRIRETEQAAAERGDQQPAAAVRNDAPARQREADARVEAQGTRRVQLPDDARAVGDPQVARVVFDQAVDVGGRAVDEAQLCAVVAIEAARGPDPHAAGAILVDAERLLAVVAVGVGHARPVVAGVAEQPVTGRRPQRAATILEERVDAGRCTVGGGIVRDAAAIDPGHASAAVEGDPHATLRGTGERGHRAGRQRAAAVLRPRLEACAVESDETVLRTEPEIAVEVLSDREHVAGLFGGPRGQRIADGRWSVRRRRWQAPAGRRQQSASDTARIRRTMAGAITALPIYLPRGVAVYLADAGQGVP